MRVSFSTVITSAFLSVLASVFVASRVAQRQERGKARQKALDDLSALVLPRWREARKVELRMGRGTRVADRLDGDDFVFASRVLALANVGPAWRRALIRRRLRILIGRMWVDRLEVQPADDTSLGAAIAPILSTQYQERQSPQYEERNQIGLYTTALMEGAEQRQVRRLRRHLGLLRRGY